MPDYLLLNQGGHLLLNQGGALLLNRDTRHITYQHPVGHWKIDEGSGPTLHDASPWRNHAVSVTSAPVWVDSKRGKGVTYSGDSRSDAPNRSVYGESPVTYIVYAEIPTLGVITLLNLDDSSTDPFTLAVGATGTVTLTARDSSAGSVALTAETAVSAGVPFSIAWTVSGLDVDLYVDGSIEDSDTLSASLATADGSLQLLPTDPTDVAVMNRVVIFNRVAMPWEIAVYSLYPSRIPTNMNALTGEIR